MSDSVKEEAAPEVKAKEEGSAAAEPASSPKVVKKEKKAKKEDSDDEDAGDASKLPSDEELAKAISAHLEGKDLSTLSNKKVRKIMEDKFGCKLKAKKEIINDAIQKFINAQPAAEEEEEAEEDEEEEEEVEDEEESRPKKKAKKGGSGATGGFGAAQRLSPALAEFLGVEEIGRTQMVKKMWEYFREHNLQNPKNKREILLDAKLKKVLGRDSMTMFSMNKYLGRHMKKPSDESEWPDNDTINAGEESDKEEAGSDAGDGSDDGGSRKRKTRAKPKSSAKKAGKRAKAGSDDDGEAKPKKKGGGFQKEYPLSEALQAVVGKERASRPAIVKDLWAYIRANNLQNPKNKKEILCDDKFKAIMNGVNKTDMFKMNKHIGKHLLSDENDDE